MWLFLPADWAEREFCLLPDRIRFLSFELACPELAALPCQELAMTFDHAHTFQNTNVYRKVWKVESPQTSEDLWQDGHGGFLY